MFKPTVNVISMNLKIKQQYKNTKEHKCQICKYDLFETVMINNYINRNVVVGNCGDYFHEYCIQQKIKNGDLSCPFCLTLWSVKKTYK